MNLLLVVYCVSALARVHSSTVTSPQIRILDVATKASETRLIPHQVEYRNSFQPYFQPHNRYDQSTDPLKSYVIYDQYPVKIFKEWKANPPSDFPTSAPQNLLEVNRNAEFSPEYYFQNGQQGLPPPKPTLAYRSVYSNVIKVFDNSVDGLDRNRFQSERYVKPFEGSVWKTPIEYEPIYPQDFPRRQGYHNLPENFPKVFSPSDKFHFPSFDERVPLPPKFFYPQGGFYDTHTINFDKDNTRHRDEVEVLPDLQQKNQRRAFLCGFIRVNQRQFPENGGPCGRSDEDIPLIPPEYPDYSNLPNDKIPVEHRRQHIQMKRIKRSGLNKTYESRQKRNAGFGYSSWGSPFGFDNGYDGYFGNNYQSRNYGNSGYDNNNNNNYYYNNNRNRNQGYRNRYYSASRFDEYDDDYQNNDDSNRGLTGYLTNGGRRYKNRKNNNDDDYDNDDDNNNNNSNNNNNNNNNNNSNNNNNDNNRDNDSDEEMERMNSNRRDTNDRRNNNDNNNNNNDRRRNNNNNNNNSNNNNNNNYDDDDYRDNNRRNNNNNNNNNRNNNNNGNNNNRRYNNNNNNNNNSNNNRRYNNDRYDNNNNNNNNNRNRYYSSSGGGSNGYNNNNNNNNNGYGSSYGGYGSNYGGSYGGGGYGSSYGGNGGYGSSYGGNGGYGSSYGGNGGYGYGGYGNGFGSF